MRVLIILSLGLVAAVIVYAIIYRVSIIIIIAIIYRAKIFKIITYNVVKFYSVVGLVCPRTEEQISGAISS